MRPVPTSLEVWLIMMLSAILNGMFRVKFLHPRFGQQTSHIISTLSLSLIIFIISYFFIKFIGHLYPFTDILATGILWTLLTIAFEFLFGRYVIGRSWDKILAEYNIFNGRIWLLVLISTFLGPILIYKWL